MPLTLPAALRRGALATAVLGLAAGLLVAPSASAAPLATDVPITARSGDTGLLDAATLTQQTAPTGTLTRELDELLATSATIALDPMIVASIRLLGTGAPESATAWLDRLATAPNEVFLLAYSDADLSALARADALDLALPASLDFAIDPAVFGPAQTATPTPTPEATETPEPTETPADPGDDTPPPLPTTEELLAWPDAVGRLAWPAEGTAASADVAAYAAAGYQAVLLDSGNVSELSNGLAALDGLPGIVADSAASDLFRQASTAIDENSQLVAIERLGVALDGLGAAHPGRSVVLTLDRGSSFEFFGLEETYAALVERPSTRMTGLGEVLEGQAESARIVDPEEPAHVAATPDLLDALAAEAEFATILDDPRQLTARRQLRFLALLAVQDAEAPEWADRAAAFLTASADILDAVKIIETPDQFVTSTQTSILVRVSNALEFPVTVRIDARPLRPRLRLDVPVDVTVEPGSSKNVRLPAEAITNGEVVVVVSLSSPSTGAAIGRPRSLTADLQAQWETVGVVVGGVVVLVFAVGIARNIVVRRRKAAAERAAEADAERETA